MNLTPGPKYTSRTKDMVLVVDIYDISAVWLTDWQEYEYAHHAYYWQ